MDRVPLCFIEEVLLLLEIQKPLFSCDTLQYPSTWGRVSASKGVREQAVLDVYFESNKEPFFEVFSSGPVPLEDLDQYVLRRIAIREESGVLTEDRHPLNKENFQLWRRHLRKGHPCTLALLANFSGVSLVEQLCLAPSRVTNFYFSRHLPLPTKLLTQSIHRGTLRWLICSSVHVTKEIFPVLLRFVASEPFEKFKLTCSTGPVSSRVVLEGAIDAFLSRPRRKQLSFVISERYRDFCGRLTGEDLREKVEVEFRCTRTLLHVCPSESNCCLNKHK
uniref:Mab-21 domain-containing protein n=1 Tax=Steinernema glaseri TaxID=37863 RepID=A0A1I7YX95_9BILA